MHTLKHARAYNEHRRMQDMSTWLQALVVPSTSTTKTTHSDKHLHYNKHKHMHRDPYTTANRHRTENTHRFIHKWDLRVATQTGGRVPHGRSGLACACGDGVAFQAARHASLGSVRRAPQPQRVPIWVPAAKQHCARVLDTMLSLSIDSASTKRHDIGFRCNPLYATNVYST